MGSGGLFVKAWTLCLSRRTRVLLKLVHTIDFLGGLIFINGAHLVNGITASAIKVSRFYFPLL